MTVETDKFGRILFPDDKALSKWDGYAERNFLEIANDWEDQLDKYEEVEKEKKKNVVSKGENWTEVYIFFI